MLNPRRLSNLNSIQFVRGRPKRESAGAYIDLISVGGVEEAPDVASGLETLWSYDLLSRWGGKAADEFAQWIGELNQHNATLDWWAYASSAKNLLSSALGNRVVEVLAIRNLARSGRYSNIYVRGATPGQTRTIGALFRGEQSAVRLPLRVRWGLDKLLCLVETFVRVFFQAARISAAFLRPRAVAARRPVDFVLLTYLEGPLKPGFDGYFGDLAELITRHNSSAKLAYVAYVYTPYRKLLRGLDAHSRVPYIPLFAYLRAGDIVRALGRTIRAMFPSATRLTPSKNDTETMVELLKESLREDVAKGGYIHNLLVHTCAVRMTQALSPASVIYPYENKSLEKALVLGVREAMPTTRLIGYQHTSITPRHLTLRFESGEAARTPLPNRIVTVGDVTRRYLDARGNYPPGILVTGCALRQTWEEPPPQRKISSKQPRVLLPLSSSVRELVAAISFMRKAKEQLSGLELGVRTHPNFPLRMLPPGLLNWVRDHAIDLTGTNLRENLAWADLTAYVSSTVALESLMSGRPVVYLKIDPFDPDPLFDDVRFRWEAHDVNEFLAALSSLVALSTDEFQVRRDEAIEYVRTYLKPKSLEAVEPFLL